MSFATLFKRKENVNEDIIDEVTLLKDEVRSLKIKLTKVSAEVLDLATGQDIIRNKVMRKIQGKKEDKEEQEGWAGIPATE